MSVIEFRQPARHRGRILDRDRRCPGLGPLGLARFGGIGKPLPIASEQTKDRLWRGISFSQSSTKSARRPGNDDGAKG